MWAVLSMGTIGVFPFISCINTYLYKAIQHSIKQTFDTVAAYSAFAQKWTVFIVLCSFAAIGYGAFKSGWLIHENTRVYFVNIEDDTNIAISTYLNLLIYKLVLLALTKRMDDNQI